MKHSLIKLFDRDLRKLKAEIEAFTNEELIWKVRGQIINSEVFQKSDKDYVRMRLES